MTPRLNGFLEDVARLIKQFESYTIVLVGINPTTATSTVITWNVSAENCEAGALILLETARELGESENNFDCVARNEAAMTILKDTVRTTRTSRNGRPT